MSRTADEYKELLKALLPPGRLWDALRESGSLADDLLAAKAEELARVDRRCDDLLDNADPRTATELLPDIERVMGLPDPCVGELPTIQQRRDAIMGKIGNVGGQSRAYFIALAARLGYTVTITEFQPFTCETGCDQPICDEDWWFVWRVNAPETTIIEFTCMSPCTEPLRAWGNELLECAIRALAPAHTHVLFGYGG